MIFQMKKIRYHWLLTGVVLLMTAGWSFGQTPWSLDFSTGGAFSLIPRSPKDSLISSAGYYGGLRFNYRTNQRSALFFQPNVRSLAFSLQRSDQLFRRTYTDFMMGMEWAPDRMSQSSLEFGLAGSYMFRTVARGTAINSLGNRQYVELSENNRFAAEAFIALNMAFTNSLSLKAGLHYSFYRFPTPSMIEGRPSQMTLGLQYRLLGGKQQEPMIMIEDDLERYREITAFKNQGVLIVQKIPYHKASEFIQEKDVQIMKYRTDSANLWLQQAFDSVYHFSRIVFVDADEMEAISAKQWKKTSTGFRTGEEPPYMIALVGSYFYELNKNVNNGLFVYDTQMQFRSLPFPGFSSFRSIRPFFYDKEALFSMVNWFNNALLKYEAVCSPN